MRLSLLYVLSAVLVVYGHSWQRRSYSLGTFSRDAAALPPDSDSELARRQSSSWTLTQPGTTGVGAMQLVVVSPTQALIIDKVQHNPLTINGHNAWSAIYSLVSHTVRPVDLLTNSFCAGGAFLSNGTLVSVGGNVVAIPADGDGNGAQGLRHFNPSNCSDSASQCAFYESPRRIRLTSTRWYPAVVKLDDGSLLVIGGSKSGAFMNSALLNNPTMEFYPPKALPSGFNGTQFPSAFLNDTLNANLFVIAFLLPGGNVFIAANTKAMLYDWRNNIETRLPDIPNGVRVSYPMAGTGVLLPLRPPNYDPTVMLCGGQTKSDTIPVIQMSSQDPASAQCASITLTDTGIAAGWTVETMPEARIMPDTAILPTGQILILNGGETGYSGYGNVQHQVGQSNADNPAFQPVLYDPTLPLTSPTARFSHSGLPTSDIARLYHSTATLTPNGEILIAGSSPNDDVSTTKYVTEYRTEILSPPYVSATRPTFTGLPANIVYGASFSLSVSSLNGTVSVALQDFGFSTHALSVVGNTTLAITAPPDATIFPPGPAWLFVVVNGVPSVGQPVMVGTGAGPPVDLGAWAK
ncbi:hypothetical protein EXIGLDRAFT_606571 [Exidia glandulosa HHB12029]|uniref:Glyoxal oxidase n=1 Tax=Exidia glandulosa HHB12029 TaxID=1314781 RepID=A0A165M4M4_EXIGL|nr:hypothetical protein EXIGLDRAFT_606571 [Exidia glandulosa HHB12029]